MNEEEQKKKFGMMIADVIQQLLRNSEELSTILEKAHDEGYDVFLSIISGVVVRQREEKPSKDDHPETDEPLPITLEFTDQDKEFLHSIGIRVPDQ